MRAESTVGRLESWEAGGMRLCLLSASRSTPRAVVAHSGSDGCVLLWKKSVKDMLDVVGSTKGYGMVDAWMELGVMNA